VQNGIALCCVAAFLLAWSFHDPSDDAFVSSATGSFDLRSPSTRDDSPVVRLAGYEAKPGKKPVLDEDEQPSEEKKSKLMPGEETVTMQYGRVEAYRQWLCQRKGKHVPYGAKPWDKPRFKKVCLQVRLKAKQASNTKIINQVVEELRRVSGMHPRLTRAKESINAFGWRKGDVCGAAVTIYGPKMYDFLERLNTIILPRIRDFEGLHPSSFDNRGNFWMGFENQEAFKELDELIDSREIVHGFDLGILNNCLTQPDGLKLMKDFGFPFGDPRARKGPKKKVKFVVMRPDK
jgi:large subunit ribosomal protein L5